MTSTQIVARAPADLVAAFALLSERNERAFSAELRIAMHEHLRREALTGRGLEESDARSTTGAERA